MPIFLNLFYSKTMILSRSIKTILTQCLFLAFLATCATAASPHIQSFMDLKFNEIDRQTSEFTCGVAAFTTILNYFYGVTTTEDEIVDEHLQAVIEERRGITLLDIKKLSENYGFRGIGYKIDYPVLLKFLKKTFVPIIVHTAFEGGKENEGHFSLVLGAHKDFLITKDTFFGNIVLTKEQFLSKWKGYIFLVLPQKDDFEKEKRSKQTLDKDLQKSIEYINRNLKNDFLHY